MKALQSPRDQVLDAVSEAFGIPSGEVESATRGSPRAAMARAAAMSLLRARGWTLARIGEAFRRDRASVHAALERVQAARCDPELARARELLGMTQGPCSRCGCTEMDCRLCVERTGEPCWWVAPDLCSACLGVHEGIVPTAPPADAGPHPSGSPS